jgi:hypothetical protein
MTTPTQSIQLPPSTQTPGPVPLDPSNPLIWILVLTALLTATEKPLNALANLLKALAKLNPGRSAPFLKSGRKRK